MKSESAEPSQHCVNWCIIFWICFCIQHSSFLFVCSFGTAHLYFIQLSKIRLNSFSKPISTYRYPFSNIFGPSNFSHSISAQPNSILIAYILAQHLQSSLYYVLLTLDIILPVLVSSIEYSISVCMNFVFSSCPLLNVHVFEPYFTFQCYEHATLKDLYFVKFYSLYPDLCFC